MLIQNQRNKWHDKFIKKKQFNTRDWALLFDWRYKNFKGKLTTCWMGPYEVVTAFDNGFIEIKKIDDSQTSFVINGHRLRLYHQPISRQDFVKTVLLQKEWSWLKRKSFLLLQILKLFCVVFIYIYVNISLFI